MTADVSSRDGGDRLKGALVLIVGLWDRIRLLTCAQPLGGIVELVGFSRTETEVLLLSSMR